MAKTVDPKQYQIYVERQGANYIDYEKITDNANKLLSDEADRRSKIKADLDSRANDIYNQLGTLEMNSDTVFSDQVLEAANQMKKSLLMDQRLLKKGAMSVTEFKQQLERAKNQMAEWGVVTKNVGEYKDNYNTRSQIDETTGEIIMAPDEMIIKESSLGFTETYNKKIYVDPVTKNTYYYEPNADDSIPDFETQQDRFMPISNTRNRFKYQNDRKLYDIQFQIKEEKEMLGTIKEDLIRTFQGEDRSGTYVLSETDYTTAVNSGMLDEFVDVIFQKTSGTDRGLANTAATMGNFTMALSEEQFKENCGGVRDGVDYCDTKYMIIVNPNDPKGMSYTFDEEFAESEVRNKILNNAKLQLGSKSEISQKTYDPNKDTSGDLLEQKQETFKGYFEDLKNLQIGNQQTFNASERDLVEKTNKRLLADPQNVNKEIVDKITRNKRGFTITYKDKNGNTRTETVERYKIVNGVPDYNQARDVSEVYQELNTFLRPSGFDQSFPALETQAKDAGFKYEYDDDDYFGDEDVETQRAFKTKKHTSFSSTNARFTLDEDDPKKVKTFESRLKANLPAGGDYDDTLADFKVRLPQLMTQALDEYGIRSNNLNFSITGIDESGSTNSFFINYTDPFSGKVQKVEFKYDKPNAKTSMQGLLVAMDNAVESIVSSYNQGEGKEYKEEEDVGGKKEEKKQAP